MVILIHNVMLQNLNSKIRMLLCKMLVILQNACYSANELYALLIMPPVNLIKLIRHSDDRCYSSS